MTTININLMNFSLVYLLLVGIAIIMKICKINHTKYLFIASFRMSVQLVLAGYILTYVFENPSALLVVGYVIIMTLFSIHRILQLNPNISSTFKWVIALAMSFSSISILVFFVVIVLNQNIFNPQHTIPICGMIIGNAMTGVSIGVQIFLRKVEEQTTQLEVLLNQGGHPKTILLPFVNEAIETALLPTINNMIGMGIVSLPGMMTGQILAGEQVSTAILYQIAITICIAAVTCLAIFIALYQGYKTLYNKDNQWVY